MSQECQIEVRFKAGSQTAPTEAEIALLLSVLPELVRLMQTQAGVEADE